MKINIKSSDLGNIQGILLWKKGSLRDKFFLGELFFKSGFDRSTVKFHISTCENAIEFIDETIRSHKDRDDFLKLLVSLSQNLISEDEWDSKALASVLWNYSLPDDSTIQQNTGNKPINKTEDPLNKIILNLHYSVRDLYKNGITSKNYDGEVLGGFKRVNKLLSDYCRKAWLGSDAKENNAVNLIFNSDKNPFRFDLTIEDGISKQKGLEHLFYWFVKYYRNPVAHFENYIEDETSFTEAMFLISSLLRLVESSDINKK